MLHNFKLIVIVIFLFSITYGCATINQPLKETEYYTLEYSPLEITGKEKLPITIRFDRFQISPLYDTDRIVYRDREFRREEYNYHRWRSNPRDMVPYFLARDMLFSQLFKGVFTNESLYPASYQMSGTVEEFFEFDDEKWYAVLSLNIVFLKMAEPNVDRRVLFQKYYTAKMPCSDKTPFAIAEAMGKAMASISQEIILDIYRHVSKEE